MSDLLIKLSASSFLIFCLFFILFIVADKLEKVFYNSKIIEIIALIISILCALTAILSGILLPVAMLIRLWNL